VISSNGDRWGEDPNDVLNDLMGPEIVARIDVRKWSRQLVLDQMITFENIFIASNTDVLAATQLDQPGVPGVYTIWASSTVGDSTITVSLGGRVVTDQAVMVLRANSEIRENEDTNFQVLARGTGRPVISIVEVTAATMRIRVKFIPAMRS